MEMEARKKFLRILFLLFVSAGFSYSSFAATVVECKRCYNFKAAAENAKVAGFVTVVDFGSDKINSFNVLYEHETRRYIALPMATPSQISSTFHRFVALASSGSAVHVIDVDESSGGFLSAYRDTTAHDVIRSASLRGMLGRGIAKNYTGADTGNATWNEIALKVTTLALTFLSDKAGVSSVIIVINWQDGSRTVYELDPSHLYEAQYVDGESIGPDGNKLPDPAAVTQSTGGSYAGEYRFQREQTLNEWIRTAQQYGIPVVNGSGGVGSKGLDCTWDGRTLSCKRK
ncbi:hypothetical protein [Novilysobacter arseniciresistens]|uniref:hypothetical protein n=1 Tax=Novilysobacter arseniciresistens TaxID=1385522 RepID=UPI00126A6C95|nr:hypothetical protein [Lysobacter arseniciresistens]